MQMKIKIAVVAFAILVTAVLSGILNHAYGVSTVSPQNHSGTAVP